MNCIEGGNFIMKKHFILFVFLLLLIYNVGCTSGSEKQEISSEPSEENSLDGNVDHLEEIHDNDNYQYLSNSVYEINNDQTTSES